MASAPAPTTAPQAVPAPAQTNPASTLHPLAPRSGNNQGGGSVTPAPLQPQFRVQDLRWSPKSEHALNGDIVIVLVGENSKKYAVHECLIRKASPFFDTAMSDKWREGHTRIVSLPKEEPEHFEAYQMWLYYGKIPVPEKTGKPALAANQEQYNTLIRLYPIGSRLMDIGFQNAILSAIIVEFKKSRGNHLCLPPRETVEYAYSNTMESDPLRKLLVSIVAATGMKYGRATDGPFLEFVLEVTNVVMHPGFRRDRIKIGDNQATLERFLHRAIESKRKREDGNNGEKASKKSLKATVEDVPE